MKQQMGTIAALQRQLDASRKTSTYQNNTAPSIASNVILDLAKSVMDTGRAPEPPTRSTRQREVRLQRPVQATNPKPPSSSIRRERIPIQLLGEVTPSAPEAVRHVPRRRVRRQNMKSLSRDDMGSSARRTIATEDEEAMEQPEELSPTVEVVRHELTEHASESSSVEEGECLCRPNATESRSERFPPAASSMSSRPLTSSTSATGSTSSAKEESPTASLSPIASPNSIGEERRVVQPRSHALGTPRSKNRAVLGYISVPSMADQRNVTAVVDLTLSKNFISATKARELGLEITLFDPPLRGELRKLSHRNGTYDMAVIIGRVELTWLPTIADTSRRFGLKLLVCHHMEPGILLGKQFEMQRRSSLKAMEE